MNRHEYLAIMAAELGITQDGQIIRAPGVSKIFTTEQLALHLEKLATEFAIASVKAETEAEKRGIEKMHDRAKAVLTGGNDEPK